MGMESNPFSSYENLGKLDPETIGLLQQFLDKAEQQDDIVSPDSVFPDTGELDTEGSDSVSGIANTIAEAYSAEYGSEGTPSLDKAKAFVGKRLSAEGGAPETGYVDFVSEKLIEILSERT